MRLLLTVCLVGLLGTYDLPTDPPTDPRASERIQDEPADPRTALRIEAKRPGEQLARLLAVCEAEAVPNPAVALANWRVAAGRPDVLSKAAQAAIAALNPRMVRELQVLDGATFALGFDAAGEPRWNVAAPRDDGTLAAFATAAALTDGAPEPPLSSPSNSKRIGPAGDDAPDLAPRSQAAVDRLGGPGSLLMARSGSVVVLAPDRTGLADGLTRAMGPARPARADPAPPDPFGPVREDASGWIAHLEAEALAGAAEPAARRAAAVLRGLGVSEVRAGFGLLPGGTLEAEFASRLAEPTPPTPGLLGPDALDSAPPSGLVLAFAFALDAPEGRPGPAAGQAPPPDPIARLFAVADAIEHLDPERTEAAPWRSRVGLMLLAAGVRAEADLWPKLRGLSGWVAADEAGNLGPAVLVVQATDESAAIRIAETVLPKLARRYAPIFGGQEGDAGTLLRVADLPIVVGRHGETVLVALGPDALAESLARLDAPETSAGPVFRASVEGRPASRFVALWPGRLPRSNLPEPIPDALARSLAEAPPITWLGWRDGAIAHDLVRWEGLPKALGILLRPSEP